RIAGVHGLSKSDRPDARSTVSDLKQMLTLGMATDAKTAWRPPVIATSSLKGEGFDELVSALGQHKAFLEGSDAGRARVRRIAESGLIRPAEELLRRAFKE